MATPYAVILDVIMNHPKMAIEAHYIKDPQGKTRKLWPYVIGHTPSTVPNAPAVEMVLCYQYEAPAPQTVITPHQSRRNFRCFPVAALDNPQPIPFVGVNPPPNPGLWFPKKLTPKQVKKQNCVEDVEAAR